MVQRASPKPSADLPDPSTGRLRAAPADLAEQLAQRSAQLRELQDRLDTGLEERGRIERALRDSETRARDAEARLRQAIESVSDGFALWDADDRLVLANQRYRDLYPALADHIRPGVSFEELARQLARSGAVPEAVGREEAWASERVAHSRLQDSEPFERQLADSRWLRVSDHRTAEGGLVTLHSEITELKRQADELREREAQLRGIIDNIPGVVYRRVRHPDGRITYPYHSPQIEQRHGFDAEAVANDPKLLQDAVHPDDRPAWLAAIEQSARQLTPFAGEYRILLRGGEFHWFRTMATPTRRDDGTVVWDGVSIDVTELKATEQALRESEERYRGLVEAGPIALLTHRNGQVSFANAKAVELFGTEAPDDLVGRPLASLVHTDDQRIMQARSEREPRSSAAREPGEARIRRLDGRTVEVEAVAVPISERGEASIQVMLLDITERKRVEERVRHLAHHDALTNLPNRALLLDRLHQALREARRERGQIAVLMLDLDHFKAINDTLGHPVGDRLLCAVADRLRTTLRESDTLARFGGDEFTLVQTRLHEPGGAGVLAAKILASLALPFLIDGRELRTTTSIGIAVCPEHGTEPEPLIEHADVALYRAKAGGRNRAEVFDDAIKGEPRGGRTIAGDRAAAPDRG
ncbi:MAG TPA: diguanylate cyclase [Geminicoccaceae bacterium]|nr:diguanylate cyclase [Geminicoccaceae bacterium]